MTNPFDDDISLFAVVFTRAIIAWNNVERSAQSVLRSVTNGGVGATAIIAHLGSRGLKEALQTVANSKPEGDELADHIMHLVDGMDIIRAYRNHYVHNLLAVGMKPGSPETFQGKLHVMEAHGKLAWIEEDLSTEKVAAFMQHCLRLSVYGERLAHCISRPNALELSKARPPLTSLEKPAWPPQLKKNRTHL